MLRKSAGGPPQPEGGLAPDLPELALLRQGQKLLFAAGPGNVAADLDNWVRRMASPDSIARTYSSEVFALAAEARLELCAISSFADEARARHQRICVRHLPKKPFASRWSYYYREWLYGFKLIRLAQEFGADAVLLDSGSGTWWSVPAFRLCGIKVIIKLHNGFWADGHEPRGWRRFLLELSTGLPLRLGANAILAVSDECLQQSRKLVGAVKPMKRFLPIFSEARLAPYRQPPDEAPSQSPVFQVAYVGRLELDKGVHLILEAASALARQQRVKVHFHLFGEGSAMQALCEAIEENGMTSSVTAHGHLTAEALLAKISGADALLMPTSSAFAEALGKSAVEAALLGVPVIASRVVPATKLLPSSMLVIEEDSAQAIVDAVLRLSEDAGLRGRLREGKAREKRAFFDENNSLRCAIKSFF